MANGAIMNLLIILISVALVAVIMGIIVAIVFISDTITFDEVITENETVKDIRVTPNQSARVVTQIIQGGG